MKTVIRLRDDQGQIIGTVHEEVLSTPTQVLVRLSMSLAVIALLLMWL